MKKVIVGTRGSLLAVTQTNWVIDQLKEKHPDCVFETKIIKTKGDLILDVALDKIGDKGLFIKEIEQALLEGSIDMAVHSMKDMPTDIDGRFAIASPPKREAAGDVLVTRHAIETIEDLPENAVIGTGSKRRSYQLQSMRSDIQVVNIRGNVNTRVSKIFSENLDGVILAHAGLKRIDFQSEEVIVIPLDKAAFIPAPAQGILAIEVLKEREDVLLLADSIADPNTALEMTAERGFLDSVNGGCHIPVGAYLELGESQSTFHYLYGDEAGTQLIKGCVELDNDEIPTIGKRVAEKVSKEVSACQE
ncbi:MAG: hydroxymethylbilane synthase [Clostridia bacterium]|nr:hydroxymethylbilane synthase [Clostridia bacterium]